MEGLCCVTCISFWIRICAARTHAVPVLVRCREKETGAANGLLGSIRDEQGVRNVVTMGRRVCGCGKSGLRSFSSESSTFFCFFETEESRSTKWARGVVWCGV